MKEANQKNVTAGKTALQAEIEFLAQRESEEREALEARYLTP
jgi:hypothetical protein